MARVGLSKRTRFEVFKRDGFVCQYCGRSPPAVLLHVDHISPVAEGGANDPDNLVTSCEECNLGKGAVPLTSIPESLAAKASRIAEAEEQLRQYHEVMKARADRIYAEKWQVAEALWPGSSQEGASRKDLQSIKYFVEHAGVLKCLELAEVAKAAKPYSERQQWVYFCGCCWNVIKGWRK